MATVAFRVNGLDGEHSYNSANWTNVQQQEKPR